MLTFAGTALAQADRPAHILAFGDSLTAGYGLPDGQGFVPALEAALRAGGHDVRVFDGGVSGDTTAGGRARLDWALSGVPDGKPDLVILALGANDALRGLSPAEAEGNLDAMLTTLGERGIPVLLAGMYAPRNMGSDYVSAFDAVHPRLADKHDVPLYPFFLDGVAQDPALNQADGIHPNEKGVAIMVERITPAVLAALGHAD